MIIAVPGKRPRTAQPRSLSGALLCHSPTTLSSAAVHYLSPFSFKKLEIIFFEETIFYLGNSRRVNVKREKKRRAAAGEEKTKQTGNESQPGATAPRCGHPVAHARTGASPQPPAARDRQLAPTGFWAHAP